METWWPGTTARHREGDDVPLTGSRLRRARLAPVGPKGREFNAAWRKVRAQVLERDGYRCRACGKGGLDAIAAGVQPRLDVHHIVRRSRDKTARLVLSNLVTLCGGPGSCHERTDWPFSRGRLVITQHVEGGVLTFETVTKADKWSAPTPGEGECSLMPQSINSNGATRR